MIFYIVRYKLYNLLFNTGALIFSCSEFFFKVLRPSLYSSIACPFTWIIYLSWPKDENPSWGSLSFYIRCSVIGIAQDTIYEVFVPYYAHYNNRWKGKKNYKIFSCSLLPYKKK
jgi:hypothetical protein